MTIGNIVSRNAMQFPEREALVFEDLRYTWRQLNARINRLANAFLSIGLEKGDKVAMLSENVPAMVEANFALAKIGVVYFPVLARLMPADIQHLVDLSDAKVLIYLDEFAPMVDEIKSGLSKIDHYVQISGETRDYATDYEAFLSGGRDVEPGVLVDASDLYIFICTGGTTGISKIGMLTHENALWVIHTTIGTMSLSPGDTGLQFLPLFHVIINNCLNALMAAGARVVLKRGFDPIPFMKTIHEEQVNIVMVVPPFLFNWIMAFPEAMAYDMSHVRMFATAAATFPMDLKHEVQKHMPNAEILYVYGLTESSGGNATMLRPEVTFDKDNSIGTVNPMLDYRIVDEKNADVGVDVAGELLLRGPAVIQGYYQREDETRKTFTDGWLHTGDVVSQDKNGFLYFVDRKKDMIKTGGENVFAKEVEDMLLTHPAVQEVGVFGLPDEKWGEKIHAAVVLKPDQILAEDELMAYAKTKLPGFKCPKVIYYVPVLPRNPSGKVLKFKLKEDFNP